MNEFESEEDLCDDLTFAAKRERALNSKGKACAVCRIPNPLLLRRIDVEEADGRISNTHLCHNHAVLVYWLNKKYFGDKSEAQKASGEKVTIPRLLIDQFRIDHEISWYRESALFFLKQSPIIPALSHKFGRYDDLRKVIAKQMKRDPFKPYPACACRVCGQDRPIMIDVHHVDRERNSDRAVYLCKNHHALVTDFQERKSFDEREIGQEKFRAFVASEVGESILQQVHSVFRSGTSQKFEQRYKAAMVLIGHIQTPPGSDTEDDQFSIT